MRNLPPGLAAHLEGGATTLCHAWKLLRRDGAVLGFTDHDRDLAFGGTTFAARTGLDAAEASAPAISPPPTAKPSAPSASDPSTPVAAS